MPPPDLRPPLRSSAPLLVVVGDLLGDVVVWRDDAGPLDRGTDNPARVVHVRGGSGANVAVVAALLVPVCFVGRVGADHRGDALLSDLRAAGVDPRVQVGGRTGTVVVLIDRDGERTMITDRGASAELEAIAAGVLDGATWLHIPWYALDGASTERAVLDLCAEAGRRSIPISVDLSSVTLLERFGPEHVAVLLATIAPAVVIANDAEAAVAGLPSVAPAGAVSVVKRGALPVQVTAAGRTELVDVVPVDGVIDTTGAGDAFAAGYLSAAMRNAAPVEAAHVGCRVAASVLRLPGAADHRIAHVVAAATAPERWTDAHDRA